ncbi:hypothetical protein OBV_33100 [Oscillibacter valericigenes Sjm18-20]|nr:hypothetical protein OBV_33100 [Oscillibacter valericigenes Sjm18-20]
MDAQKLQTLLDAKYAGEELAAGDECLYLYLPRDAAKKVLNTNFLEKKLDITATMWKLSVVKHLAERERNEWI